MREDGNEQGVYACVGVMAMGCGGRGGRVIEWG